MEDEAGCYQACYSNAKDQVEDEYDPSDGGEASEAVRSH